MKRLGLFEIEQLDHTAVVVPLQDLREFKFQEIEEEADDVLELLRQGHIKNVVVDFYKTDYYGSTALSFFVKLWNRVRRGDGKMAFCNVSNNEREVLEVTRLEQLWPVCSSRDDALKVVDG